MIPYTRDNHTYVSWAETHCIMLHNEMNANDVFIVKVASILGVPFDNLPGDTRSQYAELKERILNKLNERAGK